MSGSQCCENPPNLSPEGGNGQIQQIGGLPSYVTGPAHANIAVVLVSDVFGYEAPKLRMLADKVGAAGFYTVIPDFIHGDPYVLEKPFWEWMKDHGTDKGFEEAKAVIDDLKSKGITKIGAGGFCWGGNTTFAHYVGWEDLGCGFEIFSVVVELAKSAHIQAGVLLHPSFVSLEDIQGVKVPISILAAEIDQMSPPDIIKQFEEALNAKPEVECFVKIFKGMCHGWTVRYKDEDENEVSSANEAHSNLLDWFTKHLN